ncbi:hypothetical protein NE865_14858 [Phthorimaea operculella]|nr:hypothetical protein NE865_14858 [Phthorimaea operculella]
MERVRQWLRLDELVEQERSIRLAMASRVLQLLLRRTMIDMQRVRQWLRLDELVEQGRSIRLAMASRAGVLGLMLHSTYNHEVMERITGKANENGKLKEGS